MDFSDKVNELIDNQISKKHKQEEKRNYLGGSRLGVECERALQYEYMHTEKDVDFPPRILKIFQTGHLYEDLVVKWLKDAGFDLLSEDEDGNQFGFSTAGGKIKGHVDGIIVGFPESIKLKAPILWENKSMGNKYFRLLVKNGVKKERPEYYAQLQTYMAYMEYKFPGISDNPAMFTCINKDTSEIYHELVPFDLAKAQRLSDKGLSIIMAVKDKILLPREYGYKTHYKCKMCAWNKKCWENG